MVGSHDRIHRAHHIHWVRRSSTPAPPVTSVATCPPRGLVNVVDPIRTVGTVSEPLFALRTKARASASVQMLCHRVGTPRRDRSRRSAEQYGQPGRQYTSATASAALEASALTGTLLLMGMKPGGNPDCFPP